MDADVQAHFLGQVAAAAANGTWKQLQARHRWRLMLVTWMLMVRLTSSGRWRTAQTTRKGDVQNNSHLFAGAVTTM